MTEKSRFLSNAVIICRHLILALLIVLPTNLPAQDRHLEFEHISLEHGLSQSVVTCMMQDRKGFLWFGTMDGLNRYDGYGFTVFKHDPRDPQSLSDNEINMLYEDAQGRIWVGTRAGLCQFDRRTEKFTRYLHDPTNPLSLSHNTVTAICADDTAGEKFWVGTMGGGLDRLELDSGTFEHYQHDSQNPSGMRSNRVRALLRDREGVLWVGTYGGLSKLISTGNEPSQAKFVHYRHDPAKPNSLSHNLVWSIFEDKAGNLWIATFGGGLNRLNKQSESFTRYLYRTDDPKNLSLNVVRPIYQDQSGTLWIGTGAGLYQYLPDSDSFLHFKHHAADPTSLSNDDVWSVYVDRSGTLWVGTYGGGLNKFSPQKTKFTHFNYQPGNPRSLGHNMVMSICEDRQGTLWVGTGGGGLYEQLEDSDQFKPHRNDPNDPNSLSNDGVAAILEDRDGVLWIGTGAGLNRFERKTGNFICYQNNRNDPTSLSSNGVSSIYESASGALWIGTGAGGLNQFDQKSGRFIRYQHESANPNSLSDNLAYVVYGTFAHETETLWIGTASGLNKVVFEASQNSGADGKDAHFTHYRHDHRNSQSLSHDRVFSLCADPDSAGSVLWVGTGGGGLDRFDVRTGTFENFSEKDGLPNNVIYGILADDDGNLWLSTNNGLCKFDPAMRTFKNYDVDEGLQSKEFNQGAYFKSASGEMFFGGINGFNHFHPSRITDNPHVPPVVLTAFKKFDRAVTLDTAIAEIRQIKLSYADNFFSFAFAALDYVNPEKNQYAYMLEGFDSDWIYCGTRRYASYTNLDGGEYLLRLKGSNNDGVWNEEGVALNIIITPPFWKTWWFLVLSAASMVCGGYIFYRRKLEARLEKARLANELEAAHQMQMRLMPVRSPQVPGLELAGFCQPAAEVGGDFFDYLWLDDDKTKFGIVLVDVSEKAIAGAMTAVMTSGMVISEAASHDSPSLILQRINRSLYHKTDPTVFTTMSFAVFDLKQRILVLASAGQTQPLLKRGEKLTYLKVPGNRLPLGVQKKMEYEEVRVPLQAGDVIVFYTDGLPEAMNEKNEMFDFERVEATLQGLPASTSPRAIVETLIHEVEKFSGRAEVHDDMTIVVARVKEAEGGGRGA